MDLNHLHLHVRDLARAQNFYQTWFGFTERMREGNTIFLRNGDGFDLALATDAEIGQIPNWFHFGFRLSGPDPVRRLHLKMVTEHVPISHPLTNHLDHVTFRCTDPDGYGIEVFWEPPAAAARKSKHAKPVARQGAHPKRRTTDHLE